jgi:hypothetical protein
MTSYPPIFSTSAHSDSSAVRDVTINCGGFASPCNSSKILRQLQCATSVFAITTCTLLLFKHAIAHLRSLASNSLQPRVLKAFFTTKGNDVYALLPRWPHAGVELKSLQLRPGATVTAVATGEQLTWHPQGDATRVDAPKSEPEQASPVYALKIVGAG